MDPQLKKNARWAERATWRLAECQAECRSLARKGEHGRRNKVLRRAEQYRELVDLLRARVKSAKSDPAAEASRKLEQMERALVNLRQRIYQAATSLATARADWQALKGRWGEVADEIMKGREAGGGGAGRVPTLDFRIPPPEADTSPVHKMAYQIIRSLNL